METRRLRYDEMAEAASVHRAAFDERLPWLSGRYTPSQDATYFAEHVFHTCQVWGAVSRTRILGIVAFREGWIEQLYVLPLCQRAGVGTRLLDIARVRQRTLWLWTFRRNTRARRFYEKQGFVAIEQTDGTRNRGRRAGHSL